MIQHLAVSGLDNWGQHDNWFHYGLRLLVRIWVWLEAVTEVAILTRIIIGLCLLRLMLSLLRSSPIAAVDGLVVFVLHLWIFCAVQTDMLIFAARKGAVWVIAVVPGVTNLGRILPTLRRVWGLWWGNGYESGLYPSSRSKLSTLRMSELG